MFGDDAKMIEHYAVAHGRLQEAILEEQDSKQPLIGTDDAKAVLRQLFPDLLASDKVAGGTLEKMETSEITKKSPKNGSLNRDLLKFLNSYGIFWVPPGESSCPDGSEYVWQRGVESLQGRVTAARS